MTVSEWLYTVLLRPAPVKRVANLVLCSLLPEKVSVGDAQVFLNPKDPVVSGALWLRCFENSEIKFVQNALKPGFVFVDVGANVGLFSAIASHKLAEEDLILSLEPDPEARGFLTKTVAANGHAHTKVMPVAASDSRRMLKLFQNAENRGDNWTSSGPEAKPSLVVDDLDRQVESDRRSWKHIEVEAAPLDDLIPEDARKVFIKVDVQGAEPSVLEGLGKTLRRVDDLIMLCEFWPFGQRMCGYDPELFLTNLRSFGLELRLLDPKNPGELLALPTTATLLNTYTGRRYCNIVAFKGERLD